MKSAGIRKASIFAMAILLGLTWTVVTSAPSWADERGHGGHGRPDAGNFIWHVLKSKEALSLSDEQETKLRAIGVNFKKDKVKKEADVELAEIDMHQFFHEQKDGGAGDVEGAIRKVYGLKAELRVASYKAFQEARGVLTPEQQKKMRELHDKGRCATDGNRPERHGEYQGGSETGGDRSAERS